MSNQHSERNLRVPEITRTWERAAKAMPPSDPTNPDDPSVNLDTLAAIANAKWWQAHDLEEQLQARELPCQNCGGQNPVWWVKDDIWNRVVGTPENPRGEGIILCPSCFSRRILEQLEAAEREFERIDGKTLLSLNEALDHARKERGQFEHLLAESQGYTSHLRDVLFKTEEQLEAAQKSGGWASAEAAARKADQLLVQLDAVRAERRELKEQLEALQQGLRESWDDYANAIDEHTSEEVRSEARRRMLQRFSSYQDEGWLLEADAGAVSPTGSSASTPASEQEGS